MAHLRAKPDIKKRVIKIGPVERPDGLDKEDHSNTSPLVET